MMIMVCPLCRVPLEGLSCPTCAFALTQEQMDLIIERVQDGRGIVQEELNQTYNIIRSANVVNVQNFSSTMVYTSTSYGGTTSSWATYDASVQQVLSFDQEQELVNLQYDLRARELYRQRMGQPTYGPWEPKKKKQEDVVTLDPGKPRKITLSTE